MLRKLIDATIEPITLDQALLHLNLELDATDPQYAALQAEVGSMLTAARTECENRLRRTLIDTTWRLTLDVFPCALRLAMPRVIEVTALRYVDTSGVQQTLDPLSYQVDAESEPGWIVPAYGYQWPSTRAQANALQIDYRCGYGGDTAEAKRAAVPAPIVAWIKLALTDFWEQRARSADKAAGALGYSTLPAEFSDRLLDAYTVYGT